MFRSLPLFRDATNVAVPTKKSAKEHGPGLWRTVGSVTYSILPQRAKPCLKKIILSKIITSEIAERIAGLKLVNTLFTFIPDGDAALIPNFTDAASLDEILDMRDSWPFDSYHGLILATDVRAP